MARSTGTLHSSAATLSFMSPTRTMYIARLLFILSILLHHIFGRYALLHVNNGARQTNTTVSPLDFGASLNGRNHDTKKEVLNKNGQFRGQNDYYEESKYRGSYKMSVLVVDMIYSVPGNNYISSTGIIEFFLHLS